MQITNILRDVGADLRTRNWVYLPADLLGAYRIERTLLKDLAKKKEGSFIEKYIPENFIALWENIVRRIMMERTKKAWLNGLFLLITLVVNTLGALGFINGRSQKEVSDMYDTLITPNPGTFSIWGLIYSLLIISIVAMIMRKKHPYYQKALDEIPVLFWISCVFNMGWIIAFSYVQIELSVVFIWGFVIILSMICQKLLGIHEKNRWLLPLTFGLYTGWLFIATVVNISAALVKMKWDRYGLSEITWAVIVLIVAVVLVMVVLLKLHNVVLPLPVAWAYFGIFQEINKRTDLQDGYQLLKIISIGGMVVLIVLAGIQWYRNGFSLLPYGLDNRKVK